MVQAGPRRLAVQGRAKPTPSGRRTIVGVAAPTPPAPLVPHLVAPDAWVLGQVDPGSETSTRSLVLIADDVALLDTGTAEGTTSWLADLWSLVEPDAVRWVVISHADPDHVGGLGAVLARCPSATVVAGETTLADLRRQGHDVAGRATVSRHGMRVELGRDLEVIGLPAWDDPSTLGVLEPDTGLAWTVDAFGVSGSGTAEDAEDLEEATFRWGFDRHHRDLARRSGTTTWDVAAFSRLGVRLVVPAHGPALHGPRLDLALGLLTAVRA